LARERFGEHEHAVQEGISGPDDGDGEEGDRRPGQQHAAADEDAEDREQEPAILQGGFYYARSEIVVGRLGRLQEVGQRLAPYEVNSVHHLG
jgi:hypothetical protein